MRQTKPWFSTPITPSDQQTEQALFLQLWKMHGARKRKKTIITYLLCQIVAQVK